MAENGTPSFKFLSIEVVIKRMHVQYLLLKCINQIYNLKTEKKLERLKKEKGNSEPSGLSFLSCRWNHACPSSMLNLSNIILQNKLHGHCKHRIWICTEVLDVCFLDELLEHEILFSVPQVLHLLNVEAVICVFFKSSLEN